MSTDQQDLIPPASQFAFGKVIESQANHEGWLGNPAVIAKLIAEKVQKLIAFEGTGENRRHTAWGYVCELADILRGMDPINYPPTVLHTDGHLAKHLVDVYGDAVGRRDKYSDDQIIRTAVLNAITKAYEIIVDAKGNASVTNQVRNVIDSAARVFTGLKA